MFAEWVCLFKFCHKFISFPYWSCSLLYNIKGRSRITFVYNHLAFHKLLCNQCSSNCILMIVAQATEKSDIFHKLFILLIFLNDNLFNCLSKSISIYSPKTTILASFNRKGSWRLIQKSNLAKPISNSQCFFNLIITDYLHHSFLNNKEAQGLASLIEYISITRHWTIKHFLGDILNFRFWQIIENKMIL